MNITRFFPISILSLSLACLPLPAASAQPGLSNFYQVNDHVYRGAQPADEGWKSLATLGVKTVIDLRLPGEHSTDGEKRMVEAAGMHYVNVPMHGVVAPNDAQMFQVLALLDSAGPVFVHCKRGADRTGAVIACYRITHDHWDNKKAIQEAKADGMSAFQFGIKSYVRGFKGGEMVGQPLPPANSLSPQAAMPE